YSNLKVFLFVSSYGVSPLTEGFSFAQLGELYVSSALQWHQEGNHHIETMVKDMTGEQRKSQRGSWMERNKVGFH
ncbi:ATPase, partial [Bacillus subtilis]|nr:ATPase [Bacillus subtilis]MEC2005047.1 ATPase [Bacillus subtilis]MEC2109243.1 ATPase [Bacillus subtilis]MEC2206989.1 ATPase [Bacillus subtilis]